MMPPFISPALCAKLLDPDVRHTDENILEKLRTLRYPVLASTKLDGVRGLRFDGSLLSRTRKKIPNKHIRDRSLIMPGGFDMELWNPTLEFDPISGICRNTKVDRVTSEQIEYYVIDWYTQGDYFQRLKAIEGVMRDMPNFVHFEHPIWCDNAEHLFALFLKTEQEHGEGICFRLPNSPYHQGYCTLREQFLVKLTRFIYEEATIVDFEEQMLNGNPEKRNALGKMKRSTNAAFMYPKGTLGALIVRQVKDGVETIFRVANGIDDKKRQEIWNNKSLYVGQQITFKHKPHGRHNKPRSPIYVGVRGQGM